MNWQQHHQQATPGPWQLDECVERGCDCIVFHEEASGDTAFIAAARTAWPAAERRAEQLEQLLRQVRAEYTGIDTSPATPTAVLRLINQSGLLDEDGHPARYMTNTEK